MTTNQEKEPQNKTRSGEVDPKQDSQNQQSILTDDKDATEYRSDDERPILNDTQEGYGMNDGSNQPLSKEMLTDLQDAGQQDLQRQREEEKQAKHKND